MITDFRLKHYQEIEKKLLKQISRLEDIVFCNHLSQIIEIRNQVKSIVTTHHNDYNKIADLIKPLAKKEKILLSKSRKRLNAQFYINKINYLKQELREVKKEINLMKKDKI